jgi:hypothetical protein
MEDMIIQLKQYIDLPYLATFMLFAYLVKQYLKVQLTLIFKTEVKTVYVVLVLATTVAIPFLLFGSGVKQILLSYAIGTSLHEVLFSLVEDQIQKIKGKVTIIEESKTTTTIVEEKPNNGTTPV